MKLLIGAFSVMLAAGAATAGDSFPYNDSLTQRYALVTQTKISSFATPTNVPAVAGGMQTSEHVAVITSDVAEFTASDAEDWAECSAAVGADVQASLSMRYDENDVLSWMGYTAEGWQPLSGVEASEGAWTVKIEIDYSLQTKSVRYSVKSPGVDSYSVLTNGAGVVWLPLGGNVSVVQGIDLLGYGTVNSVSGDCATRPFVGEVTTAENFTMQYSNLTVRVVATNAWGDTVQVTLKKDGAAVDGAVATGAVRADGTCDFIANFTGKTVVGEDYTYDVQFLKGETAIETQPEKGSVKLYSEIDWFGFREGAFENATTNGIAVNETTQTFASEDDEIVGTVTPSKVADDNAQTTVETEVIVAGVSPIAELPTEVDQQFAVSLATVDSARKWCYRVGSGDWTASAAAIDTTNGTYCVKVTFDYRDGKKTGACWVKPKDGEYVPLVEGFSLAGKTKLAGTSVLGGDIGYMNASCKTYTPAPTVPEEGEITVTSNTKLDLTATTNGTYTVTCEGAGHLSWKDSDGKYAKVVNGKLVIGNDSDKKNGMDSYESYLLGLDPDVATSKPVVASEQIENASKIKFVLSGIEPKSAAETGVAVSYELQEMSDPKATTGTSTPFTDGAATVDLPASGAKYYKVKINFAK